MAEGIDHESDPDILTAEELSAKIRISAATVRRAASRGDIPGMRIGRDWRFSYKAVVATIGSPHPVDDDADEEPTAAQRAALDFPYDIRDGVPRRGRGRPKKAIPQEEGSRPNDVADAVDPSPSQ